MKKTLMAFIYTLVILLSAFALIAMFVAFDYYVNPDPLFMIILFTSVGAGAIFISIRKNL